MKIKFTNTVEDYIHWNLYHLDHSPTFQKKLQKIRLLSAVLFMSVFLALGFIYNNLIICFVGLLFIGYYYYNFPDRIRRKHSITLRKSFKNQDDQSQFGENELEIRENALIKVQKDDDKSYPWDQLSKIISIENYTFVYFKSNQIHILPQENIIKGNYKTFINALNEHLPEN